MLTINLYSTIKSVTVITKLIYKKKKINLQTFSQSRCLHTVQATKYSTTMNLSSLL